VLPASLCAKIMVFRRITRIIEVVLNERAVKTYNKNLSFHLDIHKIYIVLRALNSFTKNHYN